MKITIETVVNAPLTRVWESWTSPADIMAWNAASDDWHTTASTVDLRNGGAFYPVWRPRMARWGLILAGLIRGWSRCR